MRAHGQFLDALTAAARADSGRPRSAGVAGPAATRRRMHAPAVDECPAVGFAALSRRVRTLIVAAVRLFVVLFVLALTLAGALRGPRRPARRTTRSATSTGQDSGDHHDHRHGHPTHTTGQPEPDDGELSARSRLTVFEAVRGWLDHDRGRRAAGVGLPARAVDSSRPTQQNTQDFVASQDNATAAASVRARLPARPSACSSVLTDGPSARACSSRATSLGQRSTASRRPTGSRADSPGAAARVPRARRSSVAVNRAPASRHRRCTSRSAAPPKGAHRARARHHGATDACLAPVRRRPRAGQRDRRPVGRADVRARHHRQGRPDDLTDGPVHRRHRHDRRRRQGRPDRRHPLKMIAARDAGATVFLAPAGNCADVRGRRPGRAAGRQGGDPARGGAGAARPRAGQGRPAPADR